MLVHLTINNFAIVHQLDLEFSDGMTTITGETGAGKSIAIDALGLCLGNRAELGMVRQGAEKAEISAIFSLAKEAPALKWLQENDLNEVTVDESTVDESAQVILRRVVTKEGRSRAYINGQPVSATQQKELGQLLLQIHGQHAHQQLLRSECQLDLLDQYANGLELKQQVAQDFQQWRQTKKKLQQYIESQKENDAQRQLLSYQVNELNELNVQEGEYQQIELEHTRLSNSGELIRYGTATLQYLQENDDDNALHLIQMAQNQLNKLVAVDESLEPLVAMLDDAMIQVQEVGYELNRYLTQIELDDERLTYLDDRLGAIVQLARKHYVLPEVLYQKHQELRQQFERYDNSEEYQQQLEHELLACKQNYITNAEKLTKIRQKAALELNKKITQSMKQLNMVDGYFEMKLNSALTTASARGIDHVEFLVATNLGQGLQPLAKVASGGELSRISLAIQVITAQKVSTPTLIFDEVDSGISGATASIVGQLLHKLGASTQVLCVTHLAQVAGFGHQQMFVSKQVENGMTETQMVLLNQKQRIDELARLLGGSKITERTRANAEELLFDHV